MHQNQSFRFAHDEKENAKKQDKKCKAHFKPRVSSLA